MKTVLLILTGLCIISGCLLLWALSGRLSSKHYQRGELFYDVDIPSPTQSSHQLHIMTANLAFCGGINGLKGTPLLAEESQHRLTEWVDSLPQTLDILVVQEIDQASKRSGFINQIKAISQQGKFPYRAIAYTWDKRWVPYPPSQPLSKQFGPTLASQVIFSKYPIKYHQVHRFQKPQDMPFWKRWFYLDRVAQFARIDHPLLGDISLTHLHLEAFSQTTQVDQSRIISELIQDKKWQKKSILLGDLNTDLNNNQHLAGSPFNKTGFREVGSISPLALTYPTTKPAERLDSIWLSSDWHIKEVTTWQPSSLSDGKITDHYPIYAILEIEK